MADTISPETVIDEDEGEAVAVPIPEPTDEEADHEDTPAEQEPEPEASAPKSEADVEKATKALTREATAHANRITKIMGEDALSLVPCELCWPLAPGFHFPPEMAPLDDDQKAAVLAAIGMGEDAAPPLRDAEGVRMCDRCDGYGQLRYPTRNEHVKTQMCPACAGQGYKESAPDGANGSGVVTFAPLTTANTATIPPPCPVCGQPGLSAQPHFCAPAVAQGAS